MSTHPNVILLATLTPDDLARKTYRAILSEAGVEANGEVQIAGRNYHHLVLETDYDEGWQIGGEPGDILVFALVTYGYGEQIAWDELTACQQALAAWVSGVCERHSCTAKISVTANYW